MKRFIALCAAVLGLYAQAADTTYGPYWVKLAPNQCDIAKVYLVGTQIYGTEVGCSSSSGASYVGFYDVKSNMVYLNVIGSTTQVQGMWQVSLGASTSWLYITSPGSRSQMGPNNITLSASQLPGAIQ